MEEVKNETKQTKTQVFNVIILDKSGSMENIRQAAVSGFNETLNGIKKAQEKYADTQEHYVSLLTFCDCEKKSFPSIAKAYLQEKGTTTMKCASSAEADVFGQAVALCIAVIPNQSEDVTCSSGYCFGRQ